MRLKQVATSPPAGRQLIFGLGTGRCGTMSLARVLSTLEGFSMLHEGRSECGGVVVCPEGERASHRVDGNLPWNADRGACRARVDALLQLPGAVVGDTAFYYLPYVEWLARQYGAAAAFVCLRRERAATVQSFLEFTPGRNHWMAHDGSRWSLDEQWDDAFPTFECDSKRAAIERYWDEYYAVAEGLARRIPRFRIFDVEDLDTNGGWAAVFEFLGRPGAPVPPDTVFNSVRAAPSAASKHRFHAVMTTLDRGRVNYLERTVRGLDSAGFFDFPGMRLDVFDSGSSDTGFTAFVDEVEYPVSMHLSSRRISLVENVIRALRAGGRSGADIVIFMEDDIDVVPGLAESIDRFIAGHDDGTVVWSFHAAFGGVAGAVRSGQDSFELACPAFYGTLCLAMRAGHARLFANWLQVRHDRAGLRGAADLELNHWLMHEMGMGSVCCSAPSLVQHAGFHSTFERTEFIENPTYWMTVDRMIAARRPQLVSVATLEPIGGGYRVARSGPDREIFVNAPAALVLSMCDGTSTASDLATLLASRFGEDIEVVRGDVVATLTSAHRAGLLEWRR